MGMTAAWTNANMGREGLTSFFPEKRAQLDAMVTEAGLSRNYGGIHYKFDRETGQALGTMWPDSQ
jgi:hypothetical protein